MSDHITFSNHKPHFVNRAELSISPYFVSKSGQNRLCDADAFTGFPSYSPEEADQIHYRNEKAV